MRQYKFRAWDRRTQNMVMVKDNRYIRLYEDGSGAICFVSAEADVDLCSFGPKDPVLMQLLGQSDKNGKEIWEGDIVKVRVSTQHGGIHNKIKEFLMIVVWNDSECGFQLQEPEGADMGNYRIHNGKWSAHEIVGNIYNNPELIKP